MSEHVANWPNTAVTKKTNRGTVLICSTDGCAGERVLKNVQPANRVRRVAEREGWEIDSKWKVAACPACVEVEDAKKRVPARASPSLTAAPAPITVSAPSTSEPDMPNETASNPKIDRVVYRALDEHYDTNSMAYAAGWNDKRVADLAKCSVSHVSKIREDGYGPLEDPRIGDLRAEVSKARVESKAEGAALRVRQNELAAEIAAADKRWLEKFEDLGKRAASLTGTPAPAK